MRTLLAGLSIDGFAIGEHQSVAQSLMGCVESGERRVRLAELGSGRFYFNASVLSQFGQVTAQSARHVVGIRQVD